MKDGNYQCRGEIATGPLSPMATLEGAASTAREFLIDFGVSAQSSGTKQRIIPEWLIYLEYVGTAFGPLFQAMKRLQAEAECWQRDIEEPSGEAFDQARALLTRLQSKNLTPSGLIPSADGGIGIYFCAGKRYADFECRNDGSTSYVISDGAGYVEAFSVEMSFEGQIKAIEKIRAFLEL